MWELYADKAQQSLKKCYWDEEMQSFHHENPPSINNDRFMYCQGVMIGACIELYRCEKQMDLLENAKRILNSSLKKLVSANGILQDEGESDAGLFKGILVRYLVLLSEQCPEEKETIYDLFKKCAESMLKNMDQERFLFGPSWERQPSDSIELSCHLSGIMLLEAICRMETIETE